jgi:nicotinate dehydrogenase subunit A
MVLLWVNGRRYELGCDPETPLIYVLRNDLGLKGTRYGCGAGYCGSCLVLLDGKAVPACDTPLSVAAGRSVVTIEGLVVDGVLDPLQQAFIDEQAGQCGFCSTGMIIGARALLNANPHPTDAEIRAGLQNNLCRCGIHGRVIRAIKRVIEEEAR